MSRSSPACWHDRVAPPPSHPKPSSKSEPPTHTSKAVMLTDWHQLDKLAVVLQQQVNHLPDMEQRRHGDYPKPGGSPWSLPFLPLQRWWHCAAETPRPPPPAWRRPQRFLGRRENLPKPGESLPAAGTQQQSGKPSLRGGPCLRGKGGEGGGKRTENRWIYEAETVSSRVVEFNIDFLIAQKSCLTGFDTPPPPEAPESSPF